ncbi:MAG: hypothetical protein ACNA7X_00095 [Dehalococcoidia bacterium]
MGTEEDLNRQLEDILATIGEAKRELKALRRHPAEGARGKAAASFISGKERMIQAEEAEKHLDGLKRQEGEIRARLRSQGDQRSAEEPEPET